MDAKGQLAGMLGTTLTGIGITGLVTHTPPCVSEGQECGKMALDIGMVAGGIISMLAGKSTENAAKTEAMPEMGAGGGGGGGGGEMPTIPDFGNFNTNFNLNGNPGNNPYLSTFCSDGNSCSVPPDIYTGLDKLNAGLSNGTIQPEAGMSAEEMMGVAFDNLAKLEDAVKKLDSSLSKDEDNTTPVADATSLPKLNFDSGSDFFSSLMNKFKKDKKPQNPVRITGLEAEDLVTGRKLSLFERATRRYEGTRDYPRAFTVARLELMRQRAKQYAMKEKKNNMARSPASINAKSTITAPVTIRAEKN
jgi:hypothetical protein